MFFEGLKNEGERCSYTEEKLPAREQVELRRSLKAGRSLVTSLIRIKLVEEGETFG